MDQNLNLIKEIKRLRGKVKTLKSNIRNNQAIEKNMNDSKSQSKIEGEEEQQEDGLDEQLVLQELDNKREYATMLAEKLREMQEQNMLL